MFLFFFLTLLPPPRSTLFPYTTLFRSWVMVEGYSKELSSCGFWPGLDEGAFYAYAYPEPDGFAERPVAPDAAFYSRENGDRKSTRLNSSHVEISYAVFCLKKKKKKRMQ